LDVGTSLPAHAATYAGVALDNIEREFPSGMRHTMHAPDDILPRPRVRTPVFFGSYDWHSCVEMHWLLVRLLRAAPESVPAATIRAALDAHFTADALRTEAAYIGNPDNRYSTRPYGWGWALMLADELATWDDPDARRWTSHMRPFADTVENNFVSWLPKQTYAERQGQHGNSAFGLSRALPYARTRAAAGSPDLLDAIMDAALRWYADDADYPAAWEPSGADFISPALVEAELMSHVLPPSRFPTWLEAFLPEIADSRPPSLFTPVHVSDPTDGFIAHLHGLNLTRAWAWRRLAEELPPADPRIPPSEAAARTHAKATLPEATGTTYELDHYLAAYAVLLLT
jgi:hypothetical protein